MRRSSPRRVTSARSRICAASGRTRSRALRATPTTACARSRTGRSGSFATGRSSSCCSAASRTRAPRAAGSALVSLELLSRDSPGVVNGRGETLHELVGDDPNEAVRRLAIVCLKNGSPARETIAILAGLAESDDEDRQLRESAQKVGRVPDEEGERRG